MKPQTLLIMAGIATAVATASCQFFEEKKTNDEAEENRDYIGQVNAHIDRRLAEFNEKEEARLPIFTPREAKADFHDLSFIKTSAQIATLSIDFAGPNDTMLSSKGEQIMILTGPNMSGKSALLRQTALIVLLAQTGSFVPADSARIGYVDKIFTRVGATDNISRGESTFMVEMLETAMIMHNLSERSLVLLDEIGRGTSTYDGMSIARALVEYIHEHGHGAKTLFATHYHELNDLEGLYRRVKNYHISVKEVGSDVIFLRKLLPGGVAHSFGIHVARMAGMPREIVESAEKTLRELEQREKHAEALSDDGGLQLSFFQLDDPTLSALREKLEAADLNNMTPLQAFDLLRDMKTELGLPGR